MPAFFLCGKGLSGAGVLRVPVFRDATGVALSLLSGNIWGCYLALGPGAGGALQEA